jgi:hypothetical protein
MEWIPRPASVSRLPFFIPASHSILVFAEVRMLGIPFGGRALVIVSALLLTASPIRASSISIVDNPVTVNAKNKNGVSFKYNGTLKPTDTVRFEVTGVAFLQGGPALGINAAGVVVKPGDFPNEGIGTTLKAQGTNFAQGALLLELNGFGPVIFRPTVANGLGSSSPPQTLVFKGQLSKIFGNFTPLNNPTVTFKVNDESWLYCDNSGGFTVTAMPCPPSVPVPAAAWQSLIGLAGMGLVVSRKRLGAFLGGESR